MRKLLLIIIGALFLVSLYTIEKSNKPKKRVYLKLVEVNDFHDDFDSSYYFNGNRTDTFKLNHKCNGK